MQLGSSAASQFNTMQLFGMSDTQMLGAVMGGIAEAGDVGGAQVLNFLSDNFLVSDRQLAMLAQGGFGSAPVPTPNIKMSGPPAGKGLSKNPPGWPKGSVRTAGGYTVVPEGKTSWKVFSPGQKPGDKAATHVHGDPHVFEKDGGRWDFTKSSNFNLPDGTQIVCKTSSEKGRSVSTGLEISNGTDHVTVSNLDGKAKVSGVKQDGYEFRAANNAAHPFRDNFKLGGDGDDWFLVRNGNVKGEITGAHYDAKSQTYQQHVNGKNYRVDPNLRPPLGSDAWGNMLRNETLDVISSRFGMPPGAAALMGGLFHADHLMTQMSQIAGSPIGQPMSSLQDNASLAGILGGLNLAYGLAQGMSALGGLAQTLNGMRAMNKMASLAHSMAAAGGGFQLGSGSAPLRGGGANLTRIAPKYWDAGAGAVLRGLEQKPGPISGDDMMKAIIAGTADLDGQAAGREFNDFKKFVGQNWNRMTPDAKAKWRVYEQTANKYRAQGQTGIPVNEFAKMTGKMARAGYADGGAGAQIEKLKAGPQPVSGEAMEKAIIDGTKDLDAQAAGKEFADFQKYAKENWKSLSPEARAKFKTYEKYANKAKAKGQTGISVKNYEKMKAEMKTAQYKDKGAGTQIENLKNGPKPISGEAMEKAIVDGTKDFDSQAAGKEFQDFSKFAKENWKDMSPDAKAKFRTYEKYAKAAQAKGQTGIQIGEYNKMKAEMKTAGYADKGAGSAIEGLHNAKKPVSGADMEKAIINGTKDLDGQAAGKEFADFQKYAKENWKDLSPEAQAKYKVYQKYASAAKANGQTGIPVAEYNKMKSEMKLAGYKDKTAGAEIEKLKAGPQPVSGQAMEQAIINGTKDLDGQAAGKEFADFKNYAKENWANMSPEARAKYKVYEKYANRAQAKGQSGIDIGSYNKMKSEMRLAEYKDKGAGSQIENLKNGPKPISGQAMQDALINGTKDLDGQAAGKEYADFAKFARENWKDLSPDAKAKYRTYQKYANQAQAKGKSGISAKNYARMTAEMKTAGYQDKGAGSAIEGLHSSSKPVSGADMEKAIISGTKDLDGQAAGKEFADFQNYAKENWSSMSPEAQAKYKVYEKYAKAAKAKGQSGIPVAEYNKMKAEMKVAGYNDPGAGKQIENLKNGPKPISGEAMEKAIVDGTKDFDSQAAGKEFADFQKFAKENWSSMSPDAKAKFRTYEKFAKAAQAKGQTGIPIGEYNQMKAEMKAAGYADKGAGAAIENLHQGAKPVSGEAMEKAIIDGTKDFDSQAAGKEFADFKNYAKENWNSMSPDAKAKYQIYEKYANAAKASGQTGIPVAEYNKMKAEMRTVGYADKGAGAAIEGLKAGPQPVSGQAMEQAIIKGTRDLDAQAAGKEFADFEKYAQANWSNLTPDAKAKYGVYKKYVQSAKARGLSGIPVAEYKQMRAEMASAGYRDQGAGAAIETLKQQGQPITASSMEQAIINGTKDLDGQAAGNEYADLKQFVGQNWNSMTPAARAKWQIYDAFAGAYASSGMSGIPAGDYSAMVSLMKAFD